MKAVILAAGIGARLKPHTEHMPKAMIAVGGRPLLLRQIDAVRDAGMRPEDVVVVTGHARESILEAVPDGVRCLHNPEYRSKNNIHSFWLLRELDDDILLLNSDVLFPKRLLQHILDRAPETCLVLDASRPPSEEAMKVETRCGIVRKIGKTIRPWMADGEYVGIARFSRAAMKVFTRHAGLLLARGRDDAWYEQALAEATEDVNLYTYVLEDVPWIEIDDHQDLARAATLLAQMEKYDQEEHALPPPKAVIKEEDAWYTVLFSDPIAVPLTYFLARRLPSVTPNHVTGMTVLLGGLGAWLFLQASPAALVAGALVFHLCFVLDCVDGKLARLTGRTSHHAAFYDLFLDQLRTLTGVTALIYGQVHLYGDVGLAFLGTGVGFVYGFAIINLQKMEKTIQEYSRDAGMAAQASAIPCNPRLPETRKTAGMLWQSAVKAKDIFKKRRIRYIFFSSVEIQCCSLVIAPLSVHHVKEVLLFVVLSGLLQFCAFPLIFHGKLHKAGKEKALKTGLF